MSISPALQDPRTVLAVLKGAPLSILFAMCQEDCPRPAPVRWLVTRTDYGRGVLETALEKLKDLELVVQRGLKKASGWWLCHGVRQLALPFVENLPAQATISFIPAIGSAPAFSGQHLTEGAPDSDPGMAGTRLISGAIGSVPAFSGQHLTEGAKDNAAKKTALSSQLMDPILDPIEDQFGSEFDSSIEEMSKKTALSFLAWLNFWPDDLESYAEKTDLVKALAGYWYAKVAEYDQPAAFVRLVIDHKRRAGDYYEALAKAWLEMDDNHRRELVAAIEQASHNHKRMLILPRDFGYYIPYRQLFLIWRACQGEIAPPELMPEDEADETEQEDEIEEVAETAESCPPMPRFSQELANLLHVTLSVYVKSSMTDLAWLQGENPTLTADGQTAVLWLSEHGVKRLEARKASLLNAFNSVAKRPFVALEVRVKHW